jgi:hypothetical protein
MYTYLSGYVDDEFIYYIDSNSFSPEEIQKWDNEIKKIFIAPINDEGFFTIKDRDLTSFMPFYVFFPVEYHSYHSRKKAPDGKWEAANFRFEDL